MAFTLSFSPDAAEDGDGPAALMTKLYGLTMLVSYLLPGPLSQYVGTFVIGKVFDDYTVELHERTLSRPGTIIPIDNIVSIQYL
jgi:hypothetical protein